MNFRNLLHLLENMFDRKRIYANPSSSPNSNSNPNCNSTLAGELGELQVYFRKILLHQQNILVVSVLFNTPWLPRNLKKCP